MAETFSLGFSLPKCKTIEMPSSASCKVKGGTCPGLILLRGTLRSANLTLLSSCLMTSLLE